MKHGCYIKHNQIIPLRNGGQGLEKSRKIGSFVMNIMGLTLKLLMVYKIKRILLFWNMATK
jgi:hypothetical protein